MRTTTGRRTHLPGLLARIPSGLVTTVLLLAALCVPAPGMAQERLTFTLATPASQSDRRSAALAEIFAPMVAGFADYQPGYNGTLFSQGTEIEAISRGNLTMSIASAQELAQYIPAFSIFTAGYVHQDAAHQVRVFNDALMEPFKREVEERLGVKLLTVMYLGRRHVNLRQCRDELDVQTPDDLAGITLRMPGTEAWQFLGRALGAAPTPVAFPEVYTALATGAVDGQDNPLPTVVDAKFYEVTCQIVLTAHLVDLNYLAFSKATWDGLTADQKLTVQRAADAAAAYARLKQLDDEARLIDSLRAEGLEIYTPDVAAFRAHVQAQYQGSDFAATWPPGLLARINALAD